MYIPLIKNRVYENKFLRDFPELFDEENIIPLIEVISLKIGKKEMNVKELINYYNTILKSSFFIDFFTFSKYEYKSFNIKKVIFPIAIQSERIYNYYDDILYYVAGYKNAIPVISIKDGREFILSEQYILNIIDKLQSICPRIAIRIQAKYLEKYFTIIDNMLRANDYLLYDINESPIEPFIFDLDLLQKKGGKYKTIIINSPRKRSINNDSYFDGNYTRLIDNSIRNSYLQYNLDGFGDFAGLKDILPTPGGNGKGAALGLIYVDEKNRFFSITNRNKELGAKGHEYVIYQMLNVYNNILNPNGNCLAFKFIKEELANKSRSGVWGQWKYFTILRYISQIKLSTNI